MKKNITQHSFYTMIDIRFADPVSAIGMNERFICIGTMMGRIALMNIYDKKTILLSELSSENITGITFENNETFNVAIGDEEVLRYQFDLNSSGQNIPSCSRIRNYDNELNHKNRCETCFTLLHDSYLMLINLHQPGEGNLVIEKQPTSFRVRNLSLYSSDEGTIDMTNYSVPFDFDGKRFAWVEFLNDKERNICVQYIDTNHRWEYPLRKDFGHISHCKLMPNNKVFIVRNMNQCEIRELNNEFSKVHEFKHIGDEVIAVDIYHNPSKIIMNEMELDNVQVNKQTEKCLKVGEFNKEKELVNMDENQQINEENLSIILLDIDGNVNVWENLSIHKKFNMYDLKDINKDYKDKQFFSMGYPYYIKTNLNFYAISTDHGVFIIKKN